MTRTKPPAKTQVPARVRKVRARETKCETAEYLAMMRRMGRAAARRVADMDPDALAALAELIEDMKQVELDAAAALKAQGFSWAEIARPQGVTRQTAAWKYSPARTGRGTCRKGTAPRKPAGDAMTVTFPAEDAA